MRKSSSSTYSTITFSVVAVAVAGTGTGAGADEGGESEDEAKVSPTDDEEDIIFDPLHIKYAVESICGTKGGHSPLAFWWRNCWGGKGELTHFLPAVVVLSLFTYTQTWAQLSLSPLLLLSCGFECGGRGEEGERKT